MSPSVLAVALGVFGAVYCVGRVVLAVTNRYHLEVEQRLLELPMSPAAARYDRERIVPLSTNVRVRGPMKWRTMFNRMLPNTEDGRQRHQMRLLQAGFYAPTALFTYFAVRLGLMIAPAVAGFIVGGWGIVDIKRGLLVGSIAGIAGMMLPSIWLDRKIANRHRILRCSLSDFLDLMVVCLESGLSLQGALQRVGDELRVAHPILAGELAIVQRDIELGATVDASFRRFADRSGCDGIRMLSTFMREAQRFGTELAEALRLNADMMRSQREQAAEEMAQKASVKILIPTLLLILPAVFVVLAGPAAIRVQEAFSK